jgi:hypothetical protein
MISMYASAMTHPDLGLAALPETWIPLGATHCSLSDGARCATVHIARTPHTFEVLIEGRPDFHVALTDHASPGLVKLHLRPGMCIPPLAPQLWSLRGQDGTVFLERADGGAGAVLRQSGPGRLHLDLRLSGFLPRGYEVSL